MAKCLHNPLSYSNFAAGARQTIDETPRYGFSPAMCSFGDAKMLRVNEFVTRREPSSNEDREAK